MSISIVIDASVILKFFGLAEERHQDEADRLNAAWANGDVDFVAPSFLSLEFLNSLGRRHRMSEASLEVALASLADYGIRMHEPVLEHVAHWVSRGLTSYDATYVALAERLGLSCITDDVEMVEIAGGVVVALSDVDAVLVA